MATYNPYDFSKYKNLSLVGGGAGTGTYGGGGPFGTRVAPIPMPNPAKDLGAQYPNLAGTNAALSGDIMAQLSGKLSPGTLAAMQDYEASLSAGSGMPGSNVIPGTLGYNRGVRDLGLTAEGQVKAGEAAYNSTIPTISRTQTVDPATAANINETNAINLSAPDPAAAQSYAKQLFDEYMTKLRGPGGGSGGGPGGGTGNFASVRGGPNLSPPGSSPSTPGFDSGPWGKGYANMGAFGPASESTVGFGGGGWSGYSNPFAPSTGTAGSTNARSSAPPPLSPGDYNPANAGNTWGGNSDPFNTFDWNAALDELGL